MGLVPDSGFRPDAHYFTATPETWEVSANTQVQVSIDSSDATSGDYDILVDDVLKVTHLAGNKDWYMYNPSASVKIRLNAVSNAFDFYNYSSFDSTTDVSQTNSVRGVCFKTDGTKMYVTHTQSGLQSLKQYDLSTPWDSSTLSYDTGEDLDLNALGVLTPLSPWISDDGLTLWLIDQTYDTLKEFGMSVSWDISTATHTQSITITEDTVPSGFCWGDSGSKFYVTGTTADDVFQFACTTPYDISTHSFTKQRDVGTEDTSPNGVQFNTDGTKMFVLGGTGDDVNQYSLSTPWDIATETLDGAKTTGTANTCTGLQFRPNGGQLYIVDLVALDIREYTVGSSPIGNAIGQVL